MSTNGKSTHLPDLSFLKDKVVLVTGGTGSFGKKFVDFILNYSEVRKLIVFSRDELKQYEMSHAMSEKAQDRIRFFLGDIRDKDRLIRAFHGVDYVVHAAALKQVPSLEYNPYEAVLTNIVGAQNIIDAAIDAGVKRVVALSTDKAVNPANLYGASKLCFEKLFIAGNAYAGFRPTRFSVVRYGNVAGSRGSVIPLFMKQKENGCLTITDESMTRFWITLEGGVQMVLHALTEMKGSEVFVPKLPSMKITELAKALAPDCQFKITGIRPGEKVHEVLMSDEETARAFDTGEYIVILPADKAKDSARIKGWKPMPAGFKYSSDQTHWNLSSKDLLDMVQGLAS